MSGICLCGTPAPHVHVALCCGFTRLPHPGVRKHADACSSPTGRGWKSLFWQETAGKGLRTNLVDASRMEPGSGTCLAIEETGIG